MGDSWKTALPGLLGIAAVLLAATPAAAGFLEITDIPNPFAEDLVFGKTIKEIRLVGAEDTKHEVIHASMASKVGEVYTEEIARLDRKRLYQLGIFTKILFETIEEDDGVILVVTVAEVTPYIPAPSLKISAENGVEIGVSLSSPNLFGSASRLSVWIRGGGATNIGVRWKEPWLPGKIWRGYQIDYYHMERWNKVFEFNEDTDDFTLFYQRNLTNRLRIGPRFTFLSVQSDRPGITLSSDNRDNMPGIGFSVQRDTRNMPLYPTRGGWEEILVSKIGGDADYWRTDFDVRRYFELGSARRSIAVYSLLTFMGGEVGVNIPEYQQFAIGGTNTVRGWEVGARVGKNQFLNTLEYWHVFGGLKQYKIWFIKQAIGYQGALFIDVGTAWNTREEFHKEWIVGGGAGIRFIIPSIVMLRVDFASGQEGQAIRIFVGSPEKATTQRDRVR